MTIQTQWYHQRKDIIHQTYFSTWTVDEFIQGVDTVRNMTRSRDGTVHVIVDFNGSITLPRDFLYTLHHLDNKETLVDGYIVIVGGGTFVSSLLGIIRRLMPCRGENIHLVETLDEAQALIAEGKVMPLTF